LCFLNTYCKVNKVSKVMSRKDFSTVTVPKELYEQFKSYCKDNAINISALTSKLITEYLDGEMNDNLQDNKSD